MILEVTPKNEIGKKSIRLGINFLGKDKSRNCFTAMISERDHILSAWFIDNGEYKLISSNSEKRYASRLKTPLQYRLTEIGVDLFHEIYNQFGTFDFTFLSDTELRRPKINKSLKINDLKPNLIIQINTLILVSG